MPIRYDFSWPCYCCTNNTTQDWQNPCATCKHNVNSDSTHDYFDPILDLMEDSRQNIH